MKFQRRVLRAIVVPIALLALVIGGTVPASAYSPFDGGSSYSGSFTIGPLSWKW